MIPRVCIVVLCFARLGSASAGPRVDYDSIMNKLNYLQYKLEDIEHKMDRGECDLTALNNTDPSNEDQLDEMEQRIIAKQEILLHKLNAMEIKMASVEFNVLNISNGLKTCQALIIRSCNEEPTKQSGTYYMQLLGANKHSFEVFCEQNQFGGGWIVIQHRSEGKLDFYRGWADYREGFGNLNGDFWLGLEYVYQITSSRPYELLVEMRDYSGNYGYAHYDEFEIGDEASNYYLHKLGKYNGTAGDGLSYNKDIQFSTYDHTSNKAACPSDRQGAWWYKSCTYSNLNGAYKNVTSDWSSMSWYYFKNDYRGLVFSRMMIREKGAVIS